MSDFSFYKEIKKSRKDHKCEGCLELIPKGSELFKLVGRWADGFYHVKLCFKCNEFICKHSRDFEEGWSNGDIGISRRQYEKENNEIIDI